MKTTKNKSAESDFELLANAIMRSKTTPLDKPPIARAYASPKTATIARALDPVFLKDVASLMAAATTRAVGSKNSSERIHWIDVTDTLRLMALNHHEAIKALARLEARQARQAADADKSLPDITPDEKRKCIAYFEAMAEDKNNVSRADLYKWFLLGVRGAHDKSDKEVEETFADYFGADGTGHGFLDEILSDLKIKLERPKNGK